MKGLLILAAIGLLLWVAPAQANYWEGYTAFKRGDYQTAHREFNRLAELGHAASQFNLGYLHQHGLAVPRNPAEAVRWYRASAEQGRVEAQFSLGTLYEIGAGVPRDLVKAYRWYNLAASNVPAGRSRDRLIRHRARVSNRLSDDLRDAVETAPAPPGFTLAASLTAAEDKPAAAAPTVADIQRELAERSFNPGAIDGQMDGSTIGALSAFQASNGLAVTGETDAPTLDKLFGPEEVAPHLEPFPRTAAVRKDPTPPAVPVPPVEEIELDPYETPVQVAEAPAEDPDAPGPDRPGPEATPVPDQAAQTVAPPVPDIGAPSGEAARQETDPDEVIINPDKFRRLAEQGNATAQIILATMYHYGQGIAEDHAEAAKWYRLAAEQGRVDAMFPLGSLYESGASEPQDLVAAHKWYSLAAERVPSGKAHDIIAKRRDRVAARLPPELLATAEDTASSSEEAADVVLRNRPVKAPPPNQPPAGLVFTSPNGVTPARAWAAENVADGTVLGSLSASDPDAGEVLTYGLSEDAGGRFAIEADTGNLVVIDGARLDFEEATSHEVVVRVTDSGGLTYEEALVVALTDINESPAAAAATFVVAENAAGGTVLGRISVVDPDGGVNGTLKYALLEGGPFAIDPATGDVTVVDGASLDFETRPHFELTATATDGGGLSARALMTVTLEDDNEAPRAIEMAVGGRVMEHVPADTVVGRISASDPDAEDRLTYSLAEDAGGRFAIDPETGTIKVATGVDLNFEDVTRRYTIDPDTRLITESGDGRVGSKQAFGHKILVRVTDSGGLTHDAAVAIEVVDVNETPWAEAKTFTVKENAPDGTSVGRISAGDPDGGAYGKLSYAITEGDSSGQFAIDAKKGSISVADGTGLDFEAGSAFKLTVTVTDGDGLSDAALVTVDLLDSNEPPEDLGMTGGTVAENAKSGTLVATLLASDPDAEDRLTYSLVEDAGGRFAIDAETGSISVAEGSRFDFDEAASHEIGVQVTDSGGLSYTERLTVVVTNENFAPTGVTLSDGTVAENAAGGTLVAKISASDPDADERLTYSLTEDADGRFVIDAESGRITVSDVASLDFEEETSHQLMVRVTDSGGLTHEEALAIAVTDANESPSAEAASFDLDEIADPGTTVGRLRASDPDGGDQGRLRYAITGDNSKGRFAIDPATGTITVADGANLDFEDRRSFKLEVTATDGGGLSDSALVAIDLVDRNEPPSGVRLITGKVPENAAHGRLAGQVAAVDPDAGDSLTYGLTEDAGGRFAIDSKTGTITVADGARLDFEAAASHRLAVRVTDSGGLTYDEVFSIALTDTNEAPTAKEDNLVVEENAAAGTLVGRLSASDPDAGDRLAYGLTDNAGGRFAIDRDTGTIMVADGTGLDFEKGSGFEVTATVIDSGGLSDTVVVAVEIANRNEAPSGSIMIEGTVAENAAQGTLAAAYTATDPDTGDRVTYSLSGDAGGRFAMDPRTGLITVARGANLDFEKTADHEVTVRVTDTGGLTYDETLTIALLDVDETPATKLDLLALHGIGTNGSAANGVVANGSATNGSVLDAVIAADNKLNENGNIALGKTNRVAALQAQLIEAGFNPGPVDGKMGPLTRTALSEYQQAFKLRDLQDEDLLDHLLMRAHFRRGYKYQAQGDYEKSIEEYSEVVRINSDHLSAYFNRGLVYYEEKRYDRAIEDFDKVLGLRPDYAGAFVNRGNAYYRQGFYGQAAQDYMTAVGYWIWPW